MPRRFNGRTQNTAPQPGAAGRTRSNENAKAFAAVPSELPDVEGTRPRRLFSELVHKPCRVAWRGPSSTYGHRANLVWLQVRGRLEPRCRTESKPHPYRSANGENVQSRRQNCD